MLAGNCCSSGAILAAAAMQGILHLGLRDGHFYGTPREFEEPLDQEQFEALVAELLRTKTAFFGGLLKRYG
jgi:hypothetical protein